MKEKKKKKLAKLEKLEKQEKQKSEDKPKKKKKETTLRDSSIQTSKRRSNRNEFIITSNCHIPTDSQILTVDRNHMNTIAWMVI